MTDIANSYMLLNVPTRLETERLILQPYKPGDGQWLHAILRENKKGAHK